MYNWNEAIRQTNRKKATAVGEPAVSKPIYEVADIISNALASNGVQADTVTGRDSVQFDISHANRKIHFFMQYDD